MFGVAALCYEVTPCICSVVGSSLQVAHLQWSGSGQWLLCCDRANKLSVFESTVSPLCAVCCHVSIILLSITHTVMGISLRAMRV